MKKRSMVNLFVSTLFTASLLVPSSVAAKDIATVPIELAKLQIHSAQVYASDNLPNAIENYLYAQDVNVTTDTQVNIQYYSINGSTDVSAVVLIAQNESNEIEGTLIEDNIFFMTYEKPVSQSRAIIGLLDWNTQTPEYLQDRMYIEAIASRYVYNAGGYRCYRPLECEATITYNEKPEYFEVRYITDGYKVDLATGDGITVSPGAPDQIGEMGDNISYSIVVESTSPFSGRTYSKRDAYDYRIGLYTSGSLYASEYLTFVYKFPNESEQVIPVHN